MGGNDGDVCRMRGKLVVVIILLDYYFTRSRGGCDGGRRVGVATVLVFT